MRHNTTESLRWMPDLAGRVCLVTTLFAGLFIGLFAGAAHAAEFDDWYQVEVIIFKQLNPVQTNEIWSSDRSGYPADIKAIGAPVPTAIRPQLLGQLQQLAEEDAITVSGATLEVESGFLFEDRATSRINRTTTNNIWGSESDDADANNASEPAIDEEAIARLMDTNQPEPFRALREDARTMTTVARSLRRSKGYRVLMHEAWAQPLNSQPTPILIQTGEQYNDQYEIDGALFFSRSRFLHVQTDLWFTEFQENAGFDAAPTGRVDPDWRRDYRDLIEAGTVRRDYSPVMSAPLRHSRRMRSNTVHYIDHPYFGVIVEITEYTHQLPPGAEMTGGH